MKKEKAIRSSFRGNSRKNQNQRLQLGETRMINSCPVDGGPCPGLCRSSGCTQSYKLLVNSQLGKTGFVDVEGTTKKFPLTKRIKNYVRIHSRSATGMPEVRTGKHVRASQNGRGRSSSSPLARRREYARTVHGM